MAPARVLVEDPCPSCNSYGAHPREQVAAYSWAYDPSHSGGNLYKAS